MKIGVIGTFIRDHIKLSTGVEVDSFGGIFYSVSILANLISPGDEIYTVCYLGSDIYDSIIGRLSGLSGVKFDGIKKIDQPNTAVTLIYQTTEQRQEYLSHRLPSIELDHIRSIGPMDAWLVNFITGFELSLSTFHQFRTHVAGMVLMDYHSLSLDIQPDGLRVLRHRPDWKEWVRDVDVLQMNEAEAISILNQPHVSEQQLQRLGRQTLELGVKVCHITRGSAGSLLFAREKTRHRFQSIPAMSLETVVDVTGCGDAFAAGFLIHYLNRGDVLEATRYAHLVAGLNCTFSGTENLSKLKAMLPSYGFRSPQS